MNTRASLVSTVALALLMTGVGRSSAQGPNIVPAVPPPREPVTVYTAEYRIRVVPVTGGLSHPWGLAFRANGDILVTERDRGALRIVRDGRLLDLDVPGVPEVFLDTRPAGLMDVVVHPEDDSLVYLSYSKPRSCGGVAGATVALARGRLVDDTLRDVHDIFVAEGWEGGVAASRLHWGPDGTLFMTVGGAMFSYGVAAPPDGCRRVGRDAAQDPGTHFGKLLRLNDDGAAADDNPFVGREGYLPEIYSLGHRNQIGLAHHPDTGQLWATEHGVQGGDEANIIEPGGNYGWPMATFSRDYGGPRLTDTPSLPEFTDPELMWWPSIGPSGLTFYTGRHFPKWQGSLFVGSMMVGRMQRTGHLERVVFNRQGQEVRREWMLTDLKQRIRQVTQGPDGLLYLLTEEDDAILFRIEPALAVIDPPGNILTMPAWTPLRIPPLAASEWSTEQRGVVDRLGDGGSLNNALHTLIRAEGMADQVLPLLSYVSAESGLSPRHRALLVLRTAWLTQSRSLWASLASRAAAAGLDQDEVRRVAEGPAAGWDGFEARLIGMADELYRNSSVSDRTWRRLGEQYDRDNLIDAVVTVATVAAQSSLLNSIGVPPDAAAAAFGLPSATVAYRIEVPEREPPPAAPRVEPADGDGSRLSRTLQRHAALAERWQADDSDVVNSARSRLTPHERALLMLRTAWNTQSNQAWAMSAGRARELGLDPVRIAQGADAPGWTPKELTLIEAANDMYRDATISDPTWINLGKYYDTHQLMSIAMTVARSRLVSMTANALGVQPASTDESLPVLEGY